LSAQIDFIIETKKKNIPYFCKCNTHLFSVFRRLKSLLCIIREGVLSANTNLTIFDELCSCQFSLYEFFFGQNSSFCFIKIHQYQSESIKISQNSSIVAVRFVISCHFVSFLVNFSPFSCFPPVEFQFLYYSLLKFHTTVFLRI